MSIKLSNSSLDSYTRCSERYRLHYIEKIRTTTTKSPLQLGSAIDRALNVLLLQKKKDLLDTELEESKLDPFEVFDDAFRVAEVNEVLYDIRISDRVSYSKNDLNLDLLQPDDYLSIEAMDLPDLIRLYQEKVFPFIDECRQKLAKKTKLQGDVLRMYNYICWLSLRRKGHMLIEGWKSQIFPEIEEVLAVQKQISVENDGDVLRGVIDFIARFRDGKVYICDNKTATGLYDVDAIANSQQLAIYSEIEGIKDVAYCVMDKNLRKKFPFVKCQILKGQVPEAMVELTFEKIGRALEGIKNGDFKENRKACFDYGGCPYLGYCKSNGESIEGLIKLDRKEKV